MSDLTMVYTVNGAFARDDAAQGVEPFHVSLETVKKVNRLYKAGYGVVVTILNGLVMSAVKPAGTKEGLTIGCVTDAVGAANSKEERDIISEVVSEAIRIAHDALIPHEAGEFKPTIPPPEPLGSKPYYKIRDKEDNPLDAFTQSDFVKACSPQDIRNIPQITKNSIMAMEREIEAHIRLNATLMHTNELRRKQITDLESDLSQFPRFEDTGLHFAPHSGVNVFFFFLNNDTKTDYLTGLHQVTAREHLWFCPGCGEWEVSNKFNIELGDSKPYWKTSGFYFTQEACTRAAKEWAEEQEGKS